ncbi:MAG TPA: NAD(P)-dependent alcohol dehydrogenase [Ignavibacteriaceae bacterium]|mgnify:FL=1|jgi:2-desacetyl-2-hydroxyethyl bacteriochlorophyllide A dehydrogenase|nr:MAG: Zinc-type alcohol dehydrogenase-like protein [Ignavibacteria bacterium ADurb.Bin266]OQY69588.1 MAG: NAD(P)-dependent alcohol dehydrogenase [Ignavibacteriales bacterium UTCHB2]HQF43152.1 NAD(P)-dependent alcohol dehydrogenase [Ignavibacteriaceae bacterium]HQI40513.1 NAD(P)-dependent alcohol dehydrogenase [Ignavibacteriaceae bacterium]HQJ45651.1 NAD(P)-dependent alcohol dehydrogenase [Ignavibacteriaceae bacterium]
MKAIVCIKSGSPEVLKLVDLERPIPKQNEVLIKVIASSVTIGDVKLRKLSRLITVPLGFLFGFKPMKITGVEFAGKVESAGFDVSLFNKGDKVYGTTSGLEFGANAEFVCVPEKSKKGVIVKKPDNISFIDAAVIPVGGMTALHILKKVNINQNQKILIYGASGSVGTYAVQLAKYFGAEVTAVCSARNHEMVKSIGADAVMDYQNEDFRKKRKSYHIIFDAVGKINKSSCKNVLKNNGAFLSVKYPTTEKTKYMTFLNELIEKGKVKPVIDKTYKLDNVKEAHYYVEQGHKKGNVAIAIE